MNNVQPFRYFGVVINGELRLEIENYMQIKFFYKIKSYLEIVITTYNLWLTAPKGATPVN